MQIAERVNKIAASQSLEMAARAKAMKAAGIDVISMSLGEPDMDTPEHIRRAAQEAIENGWSHYGPVAGIESLREAIADWQNNRPNPNPSLKGRGQESFANVWGAHTANSTLYNLLEVSARENRKNPTEAESILWDILKTNNLGLHFRRQHIILDYIVDFICVEKGLVIELDGGYHNDPEQKEYDESRTAHLQELGYTELRFTNEELLTNPDAVVERIVTTATNLPSFKGRAGVRPISFETSDVIVSVGAKMAIYNAIQTAVNPGDEVIIPMPSWVSYSEMVKLAGGTVVPVQTRYEDRYCLTPEQLRKALTPKTRMLILCSPNNPTGSVYSREELETLAEILREWPEVIVLSDEIYNALVYTENINIDKPASPDKQKNAESTAANGDLRVTDNQIASEQAPRQIACEFRTAGTDVQPPQDSFQKCDVPSYENTKNKISNLKCKISNTSTSMAQFPELADRLVLVNGVSKAYAMTGYRIGWLLCKNKAFIAACTRLQGQQLTCATMVAQKAAEAALRGTQECVEQMRSVFASRRELICRLAKEIPGWKFEEPQGAFYLFPDVSALGGGDVYAERLLEKAHVAVVPGSAFGCPECIRLSYAISTEEIKEAMKRIGHLSCR